MNKITTVRIKPGEYRLVRSDGEVAELQEKQPGIWLLTMRGPGLSDRLEWASSKKRAMEYFRDWEA